MKKKYPATPKDKKDWFDFTKNMGKINAKESDYLNSTTKTNKVRKLDLHGFSLHGANKEVKKFITESFNYGYKKLIIITGKGLRSKTLDNPYISESLSVLKYSVPEFIKNNDNLNCKISKVSNASLKDGGEGAIYIFLKNKKNL